MNIKGGINERGAEFNLVMFLSDFSKLRLHCRSPRRRSLSRSRSRYGQHLYLLEMVEETLFLIFFFFFYFIPHLGLFQETGADIGLSPRRRITGALDLCPGQGGTLIFSKNIKCEIFCPKPVLVFFFSRSPSYRK